METIILSKNTDGTTKLSLLCLNEEEFLKLVEEEKPRSSKDFFDFDEEQYIQNLDKEKNPPSQ